MVISNLYNNKIPASSANLDSTLCCSSKNLKIRHAVIGSSNPRRYAIKKIFGRG
jgi:hypothetical protein